MKAATLRFAILSTIGFVLGAMIALWQGPEAAANPDAPAAVQGEAVGGSFTAVNHKGEPVTEKSWPGKYKLVFFGFTHCPDTCPAVLQKVAVVMEKTDSKGEKIVPLFVTVDPARDTPKALAPYIAGFSPLIVGLTGTEKQIKALESIYKVYAAQGSPKGEADDYDVDHSAFIYLMSPDDKLLQIASAEDPAEEVIKKIKESVK